MGDLSDEEIRRLTAEADAAYSPAVLAAQRQPPPHTSPHEMVASGYAMGVAAVTDWLKTNCPDVADRLGEAITQAMLKGPPEEWNQSRQALAHAPMPEVESIYKGAEWAERYNDWWHEHVHPLL